MSPITRVYDKGNRRLVYIDRKATPEMWDARWTENENDVRRAVTPGRGTTWLIRLTQRFVRGGGRVLEGGCGLGHNVAALRRAGYKVIGLDFAPRTIAALHRVAPELDLFLGDLRALPLSDESIDAYWSLGVIEHFYGGYDALAQEMARVIRPGGHLFLTFPYMSPLRRARAAFGTYRRMDGHAEPEGFYQFALDARDVIEHFGHYGFTKRCQSSMSGLQGFREETSIGGNALRRIEDYAGASVAVRGARFLLEKLSLIGAGHTAILVLQKGPMTP